MFSRRSFVRALGATALAAIGHRAAAQSSLLAPEVQFPLPSATLAPERTLQELLEEQRRQSATILSPGRIRLYNAHTAERLDVAYRNIGGYDDAAMAQISRFLRDWRSGTVYGIDPRIIDILSNIQGHLGRSEPLTITSGYRTQQTNQLLASMGYEVANNSYHLHGQAIDFYQPGAQLEGVKAYALSLQAGGVGYYPRDSFIHVDCGPRRQWTGNSRSASATDSEAAEDADAS